MYFSQLSERDKQIVFQCLEAIKNGNFLEDENHSRLGINKEELQKVIDGFHEIVDLEDNSNETLAINNCMNEVCHGIHFSEHEWSKWFSVNQDEVAATYRNWTKLRGWNRTGII